MEDTVELEIAPGGVVRSLYRDQDQELMKLLGEAEVARASNVEWEKLFGGWTVRAVHNPELAIRCHSPVSPTFVDGLGSGPIVSFATREEALAAEIKHFWELLPDRKKP